MPETRCSVVVPVVNEAAILRRRLERIRAWCEDQELIVVDGGSVDGSAEIAAGFADQVLSCPPGRARQMNFGAARAGGEYLLFLHCDTLPEFSLAQWRELLAGRPGWGFFRVVLSPPGPGLRLLGGAMNLRSRLSRVGTGDQALFVRTDLFRQQAGFADLPLMEDVEFCKRLRRLQPPVKSRLRVTTSSRRWQQRGVLRTVLQMWFLRLSYWLGANPQYLARLYYGRREKAPLLLVQFAREPVAGQVKTRLQPHLRPEQAQRLHSAMVLHTCRTLCKSGLAPVQLAVAGDERDGLFAQCRALGVGEVVQQAAGDLGRRMAAAIEQGLREYSAVIVVGSDAPDLNAEYLARAAQLLRQSDVVLGPAADGGYVLIGMRRWLPQLFEGIAWGSRQVLEQTLGILDRQSLCYRLLPTLVDIDRPEDLAALPVALRAAIAG